MFTLPAGAITMFMVLLYLMSGAKASIFLNAHSFAIVVVGTASVLALCTPASELKALYHCLISMFRGKSSEREVEAALMILSKDKSNEVNTSQVMISYAQHLWRQGVEKDMFSLLIQNKMEEENNKYESSVAILRNIAKYPPALGMTGTVVGLVTVFSSLSGDDRSGVGPALAVALTATFYGLLLANALIMPIADRLQVIHLNEVRDNEHVVQKLLLINNDEPLETLGRTLGE